MYSSVYDDVPIVPSLRTVATALNTTILRVRKLLITAEYFSTETSRTVQTLVAEGRSVEEIMTIGAGVMPVRGVAIPPLFQIRCF